MIFAAEFDWNSVNLGGISIGGGLFAIAVFIGPRIPQILDWLSMQAEKRRQFAREKRKEDAEMTNQLITVLKELAVNGSKQSDNLEAIQQELNWVSDWIRRGSGVSLPIVPPPPLNKKEANP